MNEVIRAAAELQLRPLAELKHAPEILDQLEDRRAEFELSESTPWNQVITTRIGEWINTQLRDLDSILFLEGLTHPLTQVLVTSSSCLRDKLICLRANPI